MEGRGEERIYEEEYIQSHSIIFRSTGGFQKPSLLLHWSQMGLPLQGAIRVCQDEHRDRPF